MIKNYHTLQKHYRTLYKANNITRELGKLSFKELKEAEKVIKTKGSDRRLTNKELDQLAAITYIKDYRDVSSLLRIEEEIHRRYVTKRANMINNFLGSISLWGEPLNTPLETD